MSAIKFQLAPFQTMATIFLIAAKRHHANHHTRRTVHFALILFFSKNSSSWSSCKFLNCVINFQTLMLLKLIKFSRCLKMFNDISMFHDIRFPKSSAPSFCVNIFLLLQRSRFSYAGVPLLHGNLQVGNQFVFYMIRAQECLLVSNTTNQTIYPIKICESE